MELICDKQFKIPVVNEQALDEFATNLTAARVLVEQSSVHNTPIFMVAKRGGANVGKKRFVQDFRKQNAASQDDKYTIRDVRESLTAVGRLNPESSANATLPEHFTHFHSKNPHKH